MSTVSFNHLGNVGRLGNCMFQYATVLGAARSSGHEPVCNLSAVPLMKECFVLGSVRDGVVDRNFRVFNEQEGVFGFSPQVLSLPLEFNVDLYGYFQTEKHFKHVADEVKKNFTFVDEIKSKALSFFPDESARYVSVHVRRSDYTHLQEIHPCPSVDYYREALESFSDHIPVVFSDDIEWCKEAFVSLSCVLKNDPIFVDSNPISKDNSTQSDITGYIDMCAMSMCDGHVIANSSFSWWGAWLGGGKTVAPKTWFGANGYKNWQDIYYEGWLIL